MIKNKLHDRLGIPHEEHIKDEWLYTLKRMKPGNTVNFGKYSYTAPVQKKYFNTFKREVTQAMNFRSLPPKK